jgi:hypothetical protein
MADIFISHASADLKMAETICSALENRHHTCWMAARDVRPGQNYMNAIVQALRDCRLMLLVFSKHANSSEEITKELALASKYKKYVIPARVEDVLPTEAYEYALADRQWIDLFRDWDRRTSELSNWIAEIAPPKAAKESVSLHAEEPVELLYAKIREAFDKKEFDIPFILKCMNADPTPNASLSLTHVNSHYSVDASFNKEPPKGIRMQLEHSDAGGYERLYYFRDGEWKYTPVRHWGSFVP